MPHLKRYKLLIEYDGTDYFGWQKQKHSINTIQAKIEKAIYAFSHQNIEIFGSGRTDSGVHALGQVAHFDLDISIKQYSKDKIQAAINAYLTDENIVILKIEEVSSEFHARFDAIQRSYKYVILNRKSKPTFNKNYVTHISYPLDIHAMQEAANILIGTHDLSSFRSAGCQSKSPIKTIDEITITQKNDIITFYIKAQSFLYHQIRNMMGTFFQIGSRKWPATEMQKILKAKDRTKAGPTAPPNGLFFLETKYN